VQASLDWATAYYAEQSMTEAHGLWMGMQALRRMVMRGMLILIWAVLVEFAPKEQR